MSTFSSNLKVELIGAGEQSGSWGTTTNNAFENVFEKAITGYAVVNFSSDADTTLTLTDGNTSQTARNLYLNLTSSGSLSTTRNLIVPNNQAGTAPIQKLYIVKNATTGGRSIQVKTASGTGITIPNGSTMMVYSNGTNVVDVATYFSSLDLGSALPLASGGTAATTASGARTSLGASTVGSNFFTLTNPSAVTFPRINADNSVSALDAATFRTAIGAGVGSVSSVAQSFTGGLISVGGSPITSSGTLALTVAGTSGGIPYFSSASTWASSGALTANALVIGGGAGVAPSTTDTGTGVLTALGINTGTSGAFVVNGGALGTPSSGTVTNLTGTASININGTVGATTPSTGAFTTLSASSTTTLSGLTASTALALDVSKNIVSVTNTGTGNNVLATSPTLTTPDLGTPSSLTLTNATGLPVSTGISGLGSNVASALGIAVGSTGAFTTNNAANTFSALQTFNGSASALAALFKSTSEVVTTSATAATGTITLDALTQPVLFYTTNSSGNWTINVRGSGSATFNSVTSTGSSTTLVFMATNGSTGYYQTGFQIDGTSVTPKWQNGLTPASGNANSIDVYTFNIIKTGSATYTVLAAQTRFA